MKSSISGIILVLTLAAGCSDDRPSMPTIPPDVAIGWQTQSSPLQDMVFLAVDFVDAHNGWIVGDSGTILVTANSGASWVIQESGTVDGLSSVDFVDANNGWVVGENGTILHTDDGGESWTSQVSGTTVGLWDVDFVDTQEGWAVGYADRVPGVILHTTDGGKSWVDENNEPFPPPRKVLFSDNSHGWVLCGSKGVLSTTDGGESWVETSIESVNAVLSLSFVDAEHGWAVSMSYEWVQGAGFNYADLHSVFHRTTDGGITWSRMFEIPHAPGHLDLSFVDHDNGWAVGYGADILHTADGGQTWSQQTSSIPNWFYLSSVVFIDSKIGWAVGDNGMILHTTTGGIEPEQ